MRLTLGNIVAVVAVIGAILFGMIVVGAPGKAFGDPYDSKIYGPTIGADSFVPGTLKCYGTKDEKTGLWSLVIEGDWASKRAADFALFYYGVSDPESNPDMSGALGPVIDAHYHVRLNGFGELSQPVSRVLPTDGKSRYLKFELDGVDPNQVYSLAGVWEDMVPQLHSDKMFPLVQMRATDPHRCN